MLPKVDVSLNQNGTILVKFEPHENTWSFPNGKKLNLFNQLYRLINPTVTADHYDANRPEHEKWAPPIVEVGDAREKIITLLTAWIDAGNLTIK